MQSMIASRKATSKKRSLLRKKNMKLYTKRPEHVFLSRFKTTPRSAATWLTTLSILKYMKGPKSYLFLMMWASISPLLHWKHMRSRNSRKSCIWNWHSANKSTVAMSFDHSSFSFPQRFKSPNKNNTLFPRLSSSSRT